MIAFQLVFPPNFQYDKQTHGCFCGGDGCKRKTKNHILKVLNKLMDLLRGNLGAFYYSMGEKKQCVSLLPSLPKKKKKKKKAFLMG